MLSSSLVIRLCRRARCVQFCISIYKSKSSSSKRPFNYTPMPSNVTLVEIISEIHPRLVTCLRTSAPLVPPLNLSTSFRSPQPPSLPLPSCLLCNFSLPLQEKATRTCCCGLFSPLRCNGWFRWHFLSMIHRNSPPSFPLAHLPAFRTGYNVSHRVTS